MAAPILECVCDSNLLPRQPALILLSFDREAQPPFSSAGVRLRLCRCTEWK